MARSPRNSYGAGAAMNRAARGFFPAFETVLWILRRRVHFSSVDGFMTGNANSDSIVNVNHSFGMLSNGLDVMGVQFTDGPTFLTFKSISLKNSNAPLGKVAFGSGSAPIETMPALPCPGLFSYAGTPSTRTRAKHCSLVFACKWFSAPCAEFFNRGISVRPTFLTAIAGRWGAICLDFIFRSANLTGLYCLSVFHRCNYAMQ
jgi:hypothetical protein